MTNLWDIQSIVEIEDPRPIKVINVVGTPSLIEKEVNLYLKDGYTLGSTLLPWKEPNSNVNLFVQQVVFYEEDDNVERTAHRREN